MKTVTKEGGGHEWVWGGADQPRKRKKGKERINKEGEIQQQAGEGGLLGNVSLLDKLFIIFIARKQKISRERGTRLDQSTEERELVGTQAADLQL